MLVSLILYLKGMRIMMFQLSGFYCRIEGVWGFESHHCWVVVSIRRHLNSVCKTRFGDLGSLHRQVEQDIITNNRSVTSCCPNWSLLPSRIRATLTPMRIRSSLAPI